ncbi:MAG: succinate-semialdehyde dehydrogenase / glutarate-semialdehyde dehydrogenase [Syntrophus sp. SKADARSKE-3]|nr:succinate-semialdehyde dehydrogenase / glutarate-semialdehyde dehydrogenase [Syntrophus sp. SKADARSKE-3]
MKIQSINPYTEQVINEFELMTKSQLDSQAKMSRKAFPAWRDKPVGERAKLVKKLGDHLRENKTIYAELMTREMGKAIKESRGEIEKCAWLCDYYAENAALFLAPEEIKTEAKKSYITFAPLGVVLAIMPWNFPFWQVFRFGIPALCAGNVILLKHAPSVFGTALSIEDAFKAAGFPDNIFKTLLIDEQTAHTLIDEDKVDAVSLTGSVRAGRQVGASTSGKIKKLVLELGGSDPFIVLDDADIEKAAITGANARMINAGQSCIAAKRFIVMENVADAFKKAFVARLRELKIGDPMDEATDVGPLSRKEIFDNLTAQLADAKAQGAEVLELDHHFEKGFFFAPAVVSNPKSSMKVLQEEVFGPIAPIVTVETEEEAILLANDTEYGLGAAVWSKDLNRAERVASRIDAGCVVINDFVKSDPRLPFGGVKKSGVGRELSRYGLLEFVNIKSIVVKE